MHLITFIGLDQETNRRNNVLYQTTWNSLSLSWEQNYNPIGFLLQTVHDSENFCFALAVSLLVVFIVFAISEVISFVLY